MGYIAEGNFGGKLAWKGWFVSRGSFVAGSKQRTKDEYMLTTNTVELHTFTFKNVPFKRIAEACHRSVEERPAKQPAYLDDG
jgi:hypothetical protein